MREFGGARKGWLVESFFPTVEDLREVLGELAPKLVVTNTRVPSDYVATPVEEWLRAYGRYVNRVVSGRATTWRLNSPLYISVMHPATTIDEIPVEGLPFKIMEPRPPVIEFAAQRLYFDKGRLGLNIFSQDDSVVFGLEISVERLAKGTRNKNVLLFQQICEMLRERSRPCVFAAGKKRLRTRLYVSTSFGPEINRHAYLRKSGLKVILG
jgi:hypothetical protein